MIVLKSLNNWVVFPYDSSVGWTRSTVSVYRLVASHWLKSGTKEFFLSPFIFAKDKQRLCISFFKALP